VRRSASNQKPQNQTPANAAGRWLREHATRIAAVWLLALLAYSNYFQGALVFDNASIIGKDTRIREATVQNVRLILTENYWYGRFETNLYRPATTLSFLFNYAILGSGANPESYHRGQFRPASDQHRSGVSAALHAAGEFDTGARRHGDLGDPSGAHRVGN
jgi:hypothetical protein